MGETMKAIRLHGFGSPEVLVYEDAPRPDAKSGEVRVRVHAVGINPPDWYLRQGHEDLPPEWRPKVQFPIIPGTDISGVVDAVGEGVSDFAVGDAVYALVRFPDGMAGESAAYAEYVSVPAAHVGRKPEGIDHVHAAGAPMSLLTAWQFLVDVGHAEKNLIQPGPHHPVALAAGKTVLVNGAAGGVGHFAVQVAKLKGAHVIAVASGRHRDVLTELGADRVIDYEKHKPEDMLRDVDLVVDAVGGESASRFLKVIRRGGALFPIFPLGFRGNEEAATLGVTVSATQVRSNGKQLGELGRLMDEGKIRVLIDSTFALADARAAHVRAARGHIQGKIVLQVR